MRAVGGVETHVTGVEQVETIVDVRVLSMLQLSSKRRETAKIRASQSDVRATKECP